MMLLSKRWSEYLAEQPKTEMGYQVVLIVVKSGMEFRAVAKDGSILEVAAYNEFPFTEDQILNILVTNEEWKFRDEIAAEERAAARESIERLKIADFSNPSEARSALLPVLQTQVGYDAFEAIKEDNALQKQLVKSVARALQDEDPGARALVLWVLGHLGGPEVNEYVIPLLEDEQEFIRDKAVGALYENADHRAVTPLVNYLTAVSSRNGKNVAGCVLGKIGADALGALLSLLQDNNPDNRRAAAVGLGCGKHLGGVEALIAALKDESYDVKSGAAEALGLIGDERAIEPLMELIEAGRFWKHPNEAASELAQTASMQVKRISPEIAKDRGVDLPERSSISSGW